MARLAFIGLGVMGYPMAGHLQARGHQVTVYNRTSSRAAQWIAAHGGRQAATPREAAQGAAAVFVCVGDDADVRSVVLGEDGAFAGMGDRAVLVDHTTASAGLARELDQVAAGHGLRFLDAPVSGGQAGAENGKLTVMVGGAEACYADIGPVMDAYAARRERIGPAGAGQLAKMVNQICIAGLVQGLAEGINFGMKAGLDMEKVIGVISGGAAQSWQMDNRARTMVAGEFDFGFAVDWMRKDLSICLAEARQNKARLPVTALVDQFYAHIQALGGQRHDTSSLIQLLTTGRATGRATG